MNQDTVKLLQQQKLAREEELERVCHLEEKMEAEMKELARRTSTMRSEMEQHNLDALKEEFAAKRECLAEECEGFEQRLNHLNNMMGQLRDEYDEQMKSCGHDKCLSFEDNNKKLLQEISAIRELHNKVTNDNTTSFAGRKSECLELLQNLNAMILKRNEECN